MIETLDELKKYFLSKDYPTYERDNYDLFLRDEKFAFNKKAIHITGTNGKGSVANYIKNIYYCAGQKVGMFMSPFLYSPLEMISVNNAEISISDYLNILNRYFDKFEKYNLSSFEIQTFIAFSYFLKENVDIAIVEVGMGGYLDATNCFIPSLSIITTVSLEHTSYLGRTVSEIAESKSGIIKENMPVLVGQLGEEALYPITLKAKQCHCSLFVVDDYHNERLENNRYVFDYKPYKNIMLNTAAKYQLKNACLAIEAVKIMLPLIHVDEEAIKKGLAFPTLPARLEFFPPNIIVDGAHNPEAMDALMESLLIIYPDKNIHTLFAAFKDKNIDLMLTALNRDTSSVVITTFEHKRARKEEDYFLYLADYSFDPDYMHAIDEMIQRYPEDIILITGSLAFSNLARQYLLLKRQKQ